MTVPGVYSPEQVQAHVDKVIASEGVDDSRAVEVMARAMAGLSMKTWEDCGPVRRFQYLDMARAALGALRALEGE